MNAVIMKDIDLHEDEHDLKVMKSHIQRERDKKELLLYKPINIEYFVIQ